MCSRLNCRFVHLTEDDKVEVCDQRVAVCRDHANGQCRRKQCKYYHIPIILPPANVMAALIHNNSNSNHISSSSSCSGKYRDRGRGTDSDYIVSNNCDSVYPNTTINANNIQSLKTTTAATTSTMASTILTTGTAAVAATVSAAPINNNYNSNNNLITANVEVHQPHYQKQEQQQHQHSYNNYANTKSYIYNNNHHQQHHSQEQQLCNTKAVITTATTAIPQLETISHKATTSTNCIAVQPLALYEPHHQLISDRVTTPVSYTHHQHPLVHYNNTRINQSMAMIKATPTSSPYLHSTTLPVTTIYNNNLQQQKQQQQQQQQYQQQESIIPPPYSPSNNSITSLSSSASSSSSSLLSGSSSLYGGTSNAASPNISSVTNFPVSSTSASMPTSITIANYMSLAAAAAVAAAAAAATTPTTYLNATPAMTIAIQAAQPAPLLGGTLHTNTTDFQSNYIPILQTGPCITATTMPTGSLTPLTPITTVTHPHYAHAHTAATFIYPPPTAPRLQH